MKNSTTVPVPELAKDRTFVTIGNIRIKLHQNLDYKSATGRQVSVGKVVDLIHPGYEQADKQSVWMRIVDTINTMESEWISVVTWYDQFMSGMFPTKPQTVNPLNHDSKEQDDTEDLPF